MARHPNDDLFEGTTMSFGEHLEELRRSLFRALIGLVLGMLLGLWLALYVVPFIQSPLEKALKKYYLTKSREQLSERYAGEGDVPVEQLNTMARRELMPKEIVVEPESFLNTLRISHPEEFGDLVYERHQFISDDVIDGDFTGLALRIVTEKESEGSPAEAIWNDFFTAEQRKQIEKLAKTSDPTQEQKNGLIVALNELVDNPKLHRAEAMNFVSYPDEYTEEAVKILREKLAGKKSIKDGTEAKTNSRRLNKLLIYSTFSGVRLWPMSMIPFTAEPRGLRPPEVNVVTIPVWEPSDITVQSLGAEEVFMIWLKAGFVTGLVISSPWIFWQIWNFVAAGLYPHEKNYVYLYLPFSLLLFLAGAALAFFFVFEPVLDFLFSFNRMMNIDPDPRISEWLGFVLFLPLGFGIAFQLPLVMLFVNRIGIIDIKTYLEKWRIAILVICVLSMVLTPADPVSMMLMAAPLTVLYFLGIGLCKWMPKMRNPFAEGYEP